MLIIGIDPGINGALATVDSHGTCAIDDLPSIATGGKGITQRKIDSRKLAELLRLRVPAGEACIVVMEDVHAMPAKKSGSAANTSLMHTKGMIEGVLGALRMDLHLVNTARWKRFYGLIFDEDVTESQRKAKAMDTARRLYPGALHLLTRVKDHNRAEGLLIAHYGLRNLA